VSSIKRRLAIWLRRPILATDELHAEWSLWIYGRRADGQYWTSPLGVLNGLLHMVGVSLVAHWSGKLRPGSDYEPTDNDPLLVPPYLSFRRWRET
jgi:hypothetical protein